MKNLVELKKEEMKEVEGGGWIYFLAGVALLATAVHDEMHRLDPLYYYYTGTTPCPFDEH